MEGSDSVFESLNLSPKLLINEVLNVVDDLLDEAFTFFIEEASKLLKAEGTDRSAELRKGVDCVRDLVYLTVGQRMQKWEEYCLRFCFRLPEGFSLPTANESSGDDLPDLNALTNTKLDEQLTFLREKLVEVGKESAELGRELHALESQALPNNLSADFIDEALQLYKNDANEMFQELTTMSSKFRAKVRNLKKRTIEEAQCDREKRLNAKHGDLLIMSRADADGIFSAKLENFHEFLNKIKPS